MSDGPVHLDAVLGSLGAFGWHQVATLLMLALVYATGTMYNVNYVFAVEEVNYRCKLAACDNGSSFSEPWLLVSSPDSSVEGNQQCQRYQQTGSCSNLTFGGATEDCQEWVYEDPHSFMAEFGLACQEWKRALVGTAHIFGNMLGLLVQGQISDRFGRKTAAVLAGTMGGVLGLAKSFAGSYWTYVGLETLEAAIGDALSPMFMLSIEIVEKEKAVLYQMILLNVATGGLIVLPYISWLVPYWRHFLRFIYAPSLLLLTYSFFLDESIRWLFSKGKRDRAIKIIERIAKRNSIAIDRPMLNKLDYVDEEDSVKFSDWKLLLKTFKSRIMMQRFLVCMVWWFTITLINYGMMISSVSIGGNKYANFSLLMLMDIPANVFYWLALAKYQRKLPLLASFLVGGVFCVSQPFVPSEYQWAGLTLLMAFETLATFSYNIVYMYTSELFPTYTRNSLVAVCSAVGRVGALLAPQAPLLMTYWSGFPPLIFGSLSLLCGVLTLAMPETAGCELPDTVQEAERVGRARTKSQDQEQPRTIDQKTIAIEEQGSLMEEQGTLGVVMENGTVKKDDTNTLMRKLSAEEQASLIEEQGTLGVVIENGTVKKDYISVRKLSAEEQVSLIEEQGTLDVVNENGTVKEDDTLLNKLSVEEQASRMEQQGSELDVLKENGTMKEDDTLLKKQRESSTEDNTLEDKVAITKEDVVENVYVYSPE